MKTILMSARHRLARGGTAGGNQVGGGGGAAGCRARWRQWAVLCGGLVALLGPPVAAQDYVRRPPDLDRLTQELERISGWCNSWCIFAYESILRRFA